MPEPRRGREHNAKGTQEAILNAAEAVFAEHGFDGARIDAIAAEAGYNKSLIGQYFGDKLGLYTEVLKRVDREMTELQTHFNAYLLENESITSNAHMFKAFLETTIGTLFDYLFAHPRFMRILTWEIAEGWQTYAKVIPQFQVDDNEPFEALFHKAHSAGLLRSGFFTLIQLTMILQICQSYLAYLPLYQMLLPDEEVSSTQAIAQAREYIVTFIVAGMMVDPPATQL
jgi:TetR/AcrR family transcriptional regulator